MIGDIPKYAPLCCGDILYVNVYRITRHYGGPEEGGWWYNAGEPLASIPVAAVRHVGHGYPCGTCLDATAEYERIGAVSPDHEWCERDSVDDPGFPRDSISMFAAHLMPADPAEVATTVATLEKLFSDEREGDIYSVIGGADVWIVVEDHYAAHWPDERPAYC